MLNIKITKNTTQEEIYAELNKILAKAQDHDDVLAFNGSWDAGTTVPAARKDFFAELGEILLHLYVPCKNSNENVLNYDENAPMRNKRGELTW